MPKTAMVVDDDPDFRLQMRMLLEPEGYEIIEAPSRADAEKALKGVRPDIAILDLMMEEFDAGFVLAHHIKKNWPDLPVILVTGVAGETGLEFDSATREERNWVRADVVLNKPIRFEQLVREVHRLVGESAAS